MVNTMVNRSLPFFVHKRLHKSQIHLPNTGEMEQLMAISPWFWGSQDPWYQDPSQKKQSISTEKPRSGRSISRVYTRSCPVDQVGDTSAMLFLGSLAETNGFSMGKQHEANIMFLTQAPDSSGMIMFFCNPMLESPDGRDGRWTRGKMIISMEVPSSKYAIGREALILTPCFRKRQGTISWTCFPWPDKLSGVSPTDFPVSAFAAQNPRFQWCPHGIIETLPKWRVGNFGMSSWCHLFFVPSRGHLHDILCQLHPILIVPVGPADLHQSVAERFPELQPRWFPAAKVAMTLAYCTPNWLRELEKDDK